ncbi:DUF2330 domain-containing protein [Streptomyces sp. NPDC001595]|uniref:DUF2330 domain-containing protein n=1 Tax=Streptomyces sp. NPDC001532 TaxID=3154520 RepID=UPI00332F71D4
MGTARARTRGRLVAVVLALLGLQIGSLLIGPAYACGCGAMVPDDARRVRVDREESVLRWDGRREQIVMSLTVEGDAERAAWIMPVPDRATVRLGDPRLFDEVRAATAPVHRDRTYFWPQHGDWPFTADGDSAGAPMPGDAAGSGVGVVGRQRLGAFDVARLTATDPAALDTWLRDNGFAFPARLREALAPYVERRWEYVAIRLAPDADGLALTGTLDTIHLEFAADAPVYPMRLSRLAMTPQSLGLYVLAGHRMEPRDDIGGAAPRVTYAGRVGETSGPLAELAQGTPFLTAVAQEFPAPDRISGDHELRRTATDSTYQQVVYEDRLRTIAGVPAWLLTVGGALAAVAAAVAVLVVRRSRAGARRALPAGEPGPDYLR